MRHLHNLPHALDLQHQPARPRPRRGGRDSRCLIALVLLIAAAAAGSPGEGHPTPARDQDQAKAAPRDQDQAKSAPKDQDQAKSASRDHDQAKTLPKDQDQAKTAPKDQDQAKTAPRNQDQPKTAPKDQDLEAAYLARLHDGIHPRWTAFTSELRRMDARYQDQHLVTELVLSIAPDGALVATEQPVLSGLAGFDTAAIDVVRDIGRLPPTPMAVRSDDGRAYIRWRFARKEPGCEVSSVLRRQLPLDRAVPRLLEDGRAREALERIRNTPLDPAHRRAILGALAAGLARLALKAQDPQERAAAAPALRHMDDGEAPLLTLLVDPVPEVQAAALQALGERALTPAVIPPLVAALETPGRVGAALLLNRLGDHRGVPAVTEALRQGESAAQAAAALRALGKTAEAVTLTRALLTDPKTRLQGTQAAAVLGDPTLARELLPVPRGSGEPLRLALIAALAAPGEQASPEARKWVYQALHDLSPAVRASAAQATARFGDHTLGLRYRLIDLLQDPATEVRAAAAAALVPVGGEAARDELMIAARDRAEPVRQALLRALQDHPIPSAPLLVRRLEQGAARPAGPGVRVASRAPASDAAPEAGGDGPAAVREEEQDDRLAERLLDDRNPQGRLAAAATWLARRR